jgi:hypothetical protein
MPISSAEASDCGLTGIRPVAVPVKIACRLVGVGNTPVGLDQGRRVKKVNIGHRRLIIYDSLESFDR